MERKEHERAAAGSGVGWPASPAAAQPAAGRGGNAARGVRLLVPLLKATSAGWMRDNAMRLSAALALYTILSLAPLLVITAKVVGALTRDAGYARDQVKAQVTGLMGRDVAAAVGPMLESGRQHGSGVLAAVVSTAVLLFSATGVFAELQD